MYTRLVQALSEAYEAAENAGIEDQALSKSINDIIIADYLGHSISPGGRGSDGIDDAQNEYEYKSTSTGVQANFHLGSNKGTRRANILHIRRKFSGITGAYLAQIKYGEIQRVAYCPMVNLLPILEQKVGNIIAGQLQPQITWEEFANIEQSEIVPRSSNRTYPIVVRLILGAMRISRDLGVDQGLFAKGGHNHVFLAQREGHQLAAAGGGADASDDADNNYEYKITITKDWNFNLGARKTSPENRRLIENKCRGLSAAYLVQRRYAELVRIIMIPSEDLERLLLAKEVSTIGNPMNLRISRRELRQFVVVPDPDYEWLTCEELRGMLRERNLPVSGNKNALIQRLIRGV